MSREEYLRVLSRELRRLPKDEYEKAMDYYVEYFEEAGPEKEQEIIKDLGSPKDVAAQIIMDAAMDRMDKPQKSMKRGLSTVWMVVLAVCAAPIALPLAIGILAMAGGVLVTAGALLLCALLVEAGAVAAGVVAVVGGIVLLFSHPLSALTVTGMGLFMIGISILGAFVLCLLFRGMVHVIQALFRRIMRRRKKA
jgi:uncharacterized membrane protein